ncbi:MAG: DUF4270 family protein, partial [Bacteroidota bacterium]|nr:DUF4270 family protein [Bacteroidota bacterium]
MKKSFILLCFLLVNAVIILISSCKEPDTVGLEVQPSSDRLTYNYIDTFKVNTISAIDNKIYTNSISLNLLGSTNDPVFGSTTASIYTQFRMPNENFSFPAKSTLDNNPAVLTLAYKKYNGNPNSSLNFNVYEIINNLSTSHNYYSDTNIAVSSNAIAKISITPNPSGNMVISGTDTTYLLNINLPADFAKKFLNSSSSNFTDNATFTNFFKGLYITTDKVNSNGSILYIDLLSTYTKLSINYKDSL